MPMGVNQMTQSAEQMEYELKHGCLWIAMSNGRYWRLRQNGNVKRWKRDLFRYRIPVKAGMYVFSEITNQTEIGTFDSRASIINSEADPNTCPYRKAILNGELN
jgi:hypothetical protein